MFDSSIAGIRVNLEAFSRAAKALQNSESADLAAEMTALTISQKAVRANIEALRATQDASRRVIDLII